MKRTVLVTGAAGFLGSHLVDRLLADGCHVIGVDNLYTGRLANLEHLARDGSFEFIEHDVVEPIPLPNATLSAVFHFACPASPPKYLAKPIETLLVSGYATHRLLELATHHRAQFVLASTSEVYGDPDVHPQPETYWGKVNPIGTRSVYDEGKRYGEAMAVAHAKTRGANVRIVRIFNTYGPRMDPDDGRVVSNFINQVLNNQAITVYGRGEQTRSFQYVDDLIEGIMRLSASSYTSPVNIGNPEEHTMLSLASLVMELIGREVPIEYRSLPDDDPKQRRPDISLAQRVLDWSPRVSVREGLKRTIAYFAARKP
jgi:nucleoside-diphosphate-sugar epimerase